MTKFTAYAPLKPKEKLQLWQYEPPPLKTDVYSQSLQQTTLNLSRAFINFFEKRAKYPRFKSKHGKQSVGFPQHTSIQDDYLKLPKIGLVKAVFDRKYAGKIKTVTVTKNSTGQYFAAINQIKPLLETMPLSQVNEAMERVLANKTRYRIVLVSEEN